MRMFFDLGVLMVHAAKGCNASDEEVEYQDIDLVTEATDYTAVPPQVRVCG